MDRRAPHGSPTVVRAHISSIIFQPRSYQNTCGVAIFSLSITCDVIQPLFGAGPSWHSGSANPPLVARTHGIRTHEDALATWAKGERVCGTYQGSSAFKCVDTDTALESCRWRVHVAPNPFISVEEQGQNGVDCTMIHYVRDVLCIAGQCVVGVCDDGFIPSLGRDRCIPRRLVDQSFGEM
ncbi:hypothetical protein BJV78DRAFT_1381921 [Lactifluus subvellereus]|nr:hypothetical protein BJV78DRAFT_1381921 [Lactifluus subvellereus]